ncbi:MAG: TonB-dependent receptor, partial [Acidobacteria bacterium]|nr:TonB-dependent receptor [Acidobacteriota bacterium]
MRIGSLMLLFWVAFALPARAQTTTATLLGTVTDAQKAVLPGAVVTSRNIETGAETTAVADANGRYRLAALRPGTYELRAELAGFASAARLGLQLFVGQEVTIDLQMALAGVAESITITAAAPLVETTKSDVSTVVDREQIDALPLNGRNFADLTRLTPDVLSNDRIGGMQSSLSNTYFVDGVTNDRAWTGGNRSGYSSENIREFRVITQQYAAEYGQASGGVVNVVTRSGTNDFEQRLFLYHRGDNLDARNAFATAKAPFDRQQYGGFAGGPILRDRLFYFASYERTHEDQTAVVSTPVERGEFPNPSDQHQIFGKGDYQLTQAHALTLRVNEDRFDAENQGVGGRNTVGYGSTSVYRNHDFYSALTSVLGSASLNELRVQYARRPGGNIPNTPNVPQLAFASSNQGKSSANPQETTEWRLGSSDFVIPNNIYAAFVQDSWRPRPNLTLNLGVRYDYESYAGILKDKNNVSPRLAVSFDPWNRGKTVLRGGGGLFQDQITLNQWLIIVLNVINAQEFIVLRNPGYPDPFGGTRQPPAPPNTELFDPNMNTPYAAHLTGGMKQELGEGFALSADYVFVRGYDQLRRRDLNAPPNGTLVRPNPSLGRQLIHESAGEREHHALLLSAERRFGARSRFQASYTLSSTKSDFEARNSTTLPTDQYDLSADWGP